MSDFRCNYGDALTHIPINSEPYFTQSYSLKNYPHIMPSRKRAAYDASFKLKVVKFAEECQNNLLAARKFMISEKQVREWRKSASKLTTFPKTKKASRGKKIQFIQEKQQSKKWIAQSGYIVARNAIRVTTE